MQFAHADLTRSSCSKIIISQKAIVRVIPRGDICDSRRNAVTYTCQRNDQQDYSRNVPSGDTRVTPVAWFDTPGAFSVFVHPWRANVSPLTHSSAKNLRIIHNILTGQTRW